MSRMFGWSLPPGVTLADIDRAFGADDEDADRCQHGLTYYYCDRCAELIAEEDHRMADALYDIDYLYLRAWCTFMGSRPEYLQSQLELARVSKAPAHAIYATAENGDTWAVYEEITAEWTKERVAELVRGLKRDIAGEEADEPYEDEYRYGDEGV